MSVNRDSSKTYSSSSAQSAVHSSPKKTSVENSSNIRFVYKSKLEKILEQKRKKREAELKRLKEYEEMSKIKDKASSRVAVFYFGRLETSPFNNRDFLYNTDQFCIRGQRRELEHQASMKQDEYIYEVDDETKQVDIYPFRREATGQFHRELTKKQPIEAERLRDHETCCYRCKKALDVEKKLRFYQKVKGICLPHEITRDRFRFPITKAQKRQRQLHKSLNRQLANSQIGENYKADIYEFVQAECGYNHCVLLNNLGMVFTFGEGLKGQLGVGKQRQFQNYVTQLTLPMLKNYKSSGQTEAKISRIKAGAYDSAAFDDKCKQMLTWGQFGNLRMAAYQEGEPWHCYSPKQVFMHVLEDKNKDRYAVSVNEYGRYDLPFDRSRQTIVDIISMVESIDWGENHCVFINKRQQIFVMGQKGYGQLGLTPNYEQYQYSSDSSFTIESDSLESQEIDSFDELVERARNADAQQKPAGWGILAQTIRAHNIESSPDELKPDAKLLSPGNLQGSSRALMELPGDPNAKRDRAPSSSRGMTELEIQLKMKKDEQRGGKNWVIVPIMMEAFTSETNPVKSVKCGQKHTQVLTKKGDLYTWGDNFGGKLGLGINETSLHCIPAHFPKKIKGIIKKDEDTDKNTEKILCFGTGKVVSVVITTRGHAFQWGRSNYHTRGTIEKYARPRRLMKDYLVQYVHVGFNHFHMVDSLGRLWGCGENEYGQLGVDDNQSKVSPMMNRFFVNKRIIDVSCGKGFTVVIAEVFNMNSAEEDEAFGYRLAKQEKHITMKHIKSYKQHVMSHWGRKNEKMTIELNKELKDQINLQLHLFNLRKQERRQHKVQSYLDIKKIFDKEHAKVQWSKFSFMVKKRPAPFATNFQQSISPFQIQKLEEAKIQEEQMKVRSNQVKELTITKVSESSSSLTNTM